MINYVIITPFFPSLTSFRGSYLLDQAIAIKKKSNYNIIVIILSHYFNKVNYDYEIEGIECKTFNIYDLPFFIFPGIFNFINFRRFTKFLKSKSIILNSKSIIHGHINYPSLNFLNFISKKYNCKTILQHHALDVLQKETGINIPYLKKIQNKFISCYFRKISDKIDIHIAVSNAVKQNLLKINSNLIDSIYICINGVDTSKFYIDKKIKNDDSKFIIGCVANFWKLKDQITLLKAVNLLNKNGIDNIILKFVGTGKTLKSCSNYSKKNQIDCEFIDEIKHSELVSFYNQLDLFILPSKYEAFGCVYLEALACGIPFIGVKNQGIEDIIKENNKEKQLINEGSFIELARLIDYYYNNKISFSLDENFKIENTIEKMLKHISSFK
tara:strand:- start:3362 stop:4513 length:1152 start_codon:yes stop_codon:yes gene_type:complete